jgi:TusA-related sulfurtransferase
MNNIEVHYRVDITGLQCPVPLIETRKMIKKAEKGQIIEFTGTLEEDVSRKEILMAVENLKQKVLAQDVDSSSQIWRILIQKE